MLHYPREQVLIVRAESLFAEPEAVYGEIIAFLGLSPFDASFQVFNATPGNRSMAAGIRARLAAFYAPYNDRLYEYLGRDLDWQR